MRIRLEGFGHSAYAAGFSWFLALIIVTTPSLLGSTQKFSVPDDLAFRIRLDDTLTSADSQVGDPFSATVVDKGEYQNARVYGHVTQIDMSGKIGSAQESVRVLNWRGFLKPAVSGFTGCVGNHGRGYGD